MSDRTPIAVLDSLYNLAVQNNKNKTLTQAHLEIIQEMVPVYAHQKHGMMWISNCEIKNAIEAYIKNILLPYVTKYNYKKINIIGILNGCLRFTEDFRRIYGSIALKKHPKVHISYVKVQSYDGQIQRDKLNVETIVPINLSTENDTLYLIMDDIYDSGNTIKTVYNYIPNVVPYDNIHGLVLLFKNKEGRLTEPNEDGCTIETTIENFPVDSLIEIPDKWVYGYGLDLYGKYRNLDDIWYLED